MKSTDDPADDLRDAELVTVAECPTEIQATIMVSVLADEGIRAVATGGFTAGFRAEAPGNVKVKTLASDEVRARQILSELKPLPDETPDQDPLPDSLVHPPEST